MVVALLAAVVGSAATPPPAPSPTPLDPALVGARSLGDRFYPTLGNGGYDVRHYDLDLAWEPPSAAHPLGRMDGVGRIELVITQPLAELSLDLARSLTAVSHVRVDGRPVAHRGDALGRKLIVPLGAARSRGDEVVIEVGWWAEPHGVHRLGEALPLAGMGVDADRVARGFLPDGDGGAFLASQPNGAHTLFPSNDHPTDKATFTVRVTAPAGMLGVATGRRVLGLANADGSTTTTWESGAPVATHVLALGVGRLAIVEGDLPGGIGVRSAVPAALAPISGFRLDGIADAVAWLEREIGRAYPFDTIGIQLVPPGATQAVLEGQTLVLAGAEMLDPRIAWCRWQALLVHEVAHQWFGDAVSLVAWDEKWLSEGHATWYERRWAAEAGCDPLGFERRIARIHREGRATRASDGPPARPNLPADAYGPAVYDQGALVLEALRREVGDATFRAIEQAWVDRYAGTSASTDQFVELASDVAGRDLGPFLDAWLRGDAVPPLPADPDASPAPPAILRPDGTRRPGDPEG